MLTLPLVIIGGTLREHGVISANIRYGNMGGALHPFFGIGGDDFNTSAVGREHGGAVPSMCFHQGRISGPALPSGLGRFLTFDHAGFILESNSSSASFGCLTLSLGRMGMYLLSGRSITRP